jgi:uncharacterized protein (TIGR02246 family)
MTTPSVLEEKDAIRELIARYCLHIDGGDFDAWAATFTEDGVFEVVGLFRFEGRESIREFANHIPKNERGQTGIKHLTMNHVIEVDGEIARATCNLLVVREGTPLHADIVGRYEDRLVKQAGRWLFKRRMTHFDYRSGA